MSEQTPPEIAPFFDILGQRKVRGLVALDVRGISAVSDFVIICSGLSSRQVSAIGEHVVSSMKDRKRKPLGVEGINEGQWALLDYADVVVHIFHDPVRSFYDLEGLWSDARRIYPASAKEEEL